METITDTFRNRLVYSNQSRALHVDLVGAAELSIEGYGHPIVAHESLIEWIESIVHGKSMLLRSTCLSASGRCPIDENADHYGVSERGQILLNLRSCASMWIRQGWRNLCTEIAGLYGPERHLLLNLLRKANHQRIGHRIFNLLHQTDAVSSILTCLQSFSASSSILNVSDNKCASRMEIVEWMLIVWDQKTCF